jgi:HD-like signal output (HDOD) protein
MNITEIFKDPEDLPTLPAIFNKLMGCINDPDKSNEDLEKIIHLDPALATQLMKMANSSVYKFPQKVDTLSLAIQVIGTKPLLDLITGMLVVGEFKTISPAFVTMESFWSHSIGCGIAAGKIAHRILPKKEEQLFLAGMLHDIGSLFIYMNLPDQAEKALSRCNGWGMELSSAEKMEFGFDHAEVGSMIFKEWGLPGVFIETIRFHHTPARAKKYKLETAIVHVANYITMSNHLGSNGQNQGVQMNPNILKMMGLTEEFLAEVSEATIDAFKETYAIFFTPQA